MRTYLTQPFTEAQAQALDERNPVVGSTLPELAKQTATAEAIKKAREYKEKGVWANYAENNIDLTERDREFVNKVWYTLPGSTCFNDALRLVAFARLH